MNLVVAGAGFPRRWAVYCRERFPPARHGVVIAAFVFAALGIVDAGSGRRGALSPWPFALAFALAFLCFLELRLHDEFKDADDDAKYRPYRPVPRGLVTLRELRAVGLAAVLVQFALAALAGPAALALLVVTLGYMALMRMEFFVPVWLRARPLAYVASHTVVVPLIALVVAASPGRMPDLAVLAPFLALAYASSAVFEFGRKIRAPADERTGVETYSALWGPRIAAGGWWATLVLSALLATATAASFGGARVVGALAAAAIVAATALALRFAATPTTRASKLIEALSGIWLIAAYLALGFTAFGATR